MLKTLLLSAGLFLAVSLAAQTGCPGCIVSLPNSLPADTLFLPALPDGEAGKVYNTNLSFRMPQTTTPVYAVDSTTPPGLTISEIEILAVEGLPAGLNWQPNQFIFNPTNQSDGCFRICGTPLQTDSFVLTVRLRAKVLFINQETSFPMRLYIAPPTSSNDGFTAVNTIGCGTTTVSFANSNPSGGQPGYTYSWDFGDGSTFIGENPPAHYYAQPGQYIVKYNATIDTSQYQLIAVTALSVTCDDQLGLGAPDLYLYVKNQNGTLIYNSGADVTNASLPYTWGMAIPLGTGNYSLEVWDEDSGLKGSDDPCGSVSFNYLSNDTLVAGGFRAVISIEKPVTEIFATDTIIVYPDPIAPEVEAPYGVRFCYGSDSLILVSSNGTNNQWYFEGEKINGAVQFYYIPDETGYYQVEALTPWGCSSISDSIYIVVDSFPALPVFENDSNLLRVADTLSLPPNYSLQWLFFNSPITGATGLTYCATESGIYDLVVTNMETGCTNQYGLGVTYDPDFDCTVGFNTPDIAGALKIFPNPAALETWIALENDGPQRGRLEIRDVAGRLIEQKQVVQGPVRIDVSTWQSGLYFVVFMEENGRQWLGKIVH